MSRADAIALAYLVTIICFILALRFLSSPARARQGNWVGAFGMAVAIVGDVLPRRAREPGSILLVMAVCAPIGWYAARAVKMTAMPQMVALFNGVGGGAAALVALAEFHEAAPEPGDLDLQRLGLDRAQRADRLDLVRGQRGRVREAAGADRRAADRLPGPEGRQRAAVAAIVALRDRGHRRRAAASGARPC